jgi:hypothetical protein
MRRFFWGLLIATSLNAATPGTLLLMNDSPFILTASVYTQYGEFLGQSTIQSGQQAHITVNLYSTPINRPGAPNFNITPYRIIWQCAGGNIYSMCTDGATSSLIRATLCPGLLVCLKKEEPEVTNETKKKESKKQPFPFTPSR